MKRFPVLVLFILLLSGCTSEMSAEEIATKMQEKYGALEDYRGKMVVTVTTPEGEQSYIAKFAFKKPQKSRYEYLSPEEVKGNVVVSNGETMWVYSARDNTVRKIEMRKTEMPEVDYGEVIRDMLEKYSVAFMGSEKVSNRDCYVLELTPKEEDVRIKQRVWVDKEYWMPLKMVMEMEVMGESIKTSVEYRDMEFNVGIPDSEFEFEVPEGAKVTQRQMPQPKVFTSIEDARAEVDFEILEPGYVPEGYELESVIVMEIQGKSSAALSYRKGSRIMVLSETMGEEDGNAMRNSERVDINGREGKMIELGNSRLLRWMCGELTLSLGGELEKEEMIKVAESVKC